MNHLILTILLSLNNSTDTIPGRQVEVMEQYDTIKCVMLTTDTGKKYGGYTSYTVTVMDSIYEPYSSFFKQTEIIWQYGYVVYRKERKWDIVTQAFSTSREFVCHLDRNKKPFSNTIVWPNYVEIK
jgi:hypothetical protein